MKNNREFIKIFWMSLIVLFLIVIYYVSPSIILSAITYRIGEFRANKVSLNEFTEEYISPHGFTFNYPNGTSFNESSVNPYIQSSRVLRVFSNGILEGLTCDIYYKPYTPSDSKIDQEYETKKMNGLEWKKWRWTEDTGSSLDAHLTYWNINNGKTNITVQSINEVEEYCEKMISTLRFDTNKK